MELTKIFILLSSVSAVYGVTMSLSISNAHPLINTPFSITVVLTQASVPYTSPVTVTVSSPNLIGGSSIVNSVGTLSFTGLQYTQAGSDTITVHMSELRTTPSITKTLNVQALTELITLVANPTLYTTVKNAFFNHFTSSPVMGVLLRFSFHDAGTYVAADGSGGSHASIRFNKELSHAANSGLPRANSIINNFKNMFPDVSYADLIQIGGYAAIEFAGGPAIPFRFGRVDAQTDAECVPEGRLPDSHADVDGLRGTFYKMGFNDEDIVTLSGAHSLGRAHPQFSGFDGPWTSDERIFNNHYFVELTDAVPDADLLRMPSDSTLLTNPDMNACVFSFANDQNLFFQKYADVQRRLSELGYQ